MKRHKNDVWVYAEGGGDKCPALESDFRKAFSDFFDKAGLNNRKPKVIGCGSRENAFRDFKLALEQGRNALLLVDSENPVAEIHQPTSANRFLPWAHLKTSDNWEKPSQATDDDCHLMVQCMESWFITDWGVVSGYFGKEFKDAAKPTQPCENLSKEVIFNALKKATQDCKKGKYDKGAHSFKLLALISPQPLREASPWANRFIEEVSKRKSAS